MKIFSFFKLKKCSTLVEAKAQANKRLIFAFIVTAILAACLAALFLLGTPTQKLIFTAIIIILYIVVWNFWLIATKETSRLKKGTCKKCGARYAFEDVKMKFVGKRVLQSPSGQQGRYFKNERYEYDFSCICKECGAKSSFRESFLKRQDTIDGIGKVLATNIVKSDDEINEEIKRFFR